MSGDTLPDCPFISSPSPSRQRPPGGHLQVESLWTDVAPLHRCFASQKSNPTPPCCSDTQHYPEMPLTCISKAAVHGVFVFLSVATHMLQTNHHTPFTQVTGSRPLSVISPGVWRCRRPTLICHFLILTEFQQEIKEPHGTEVTFIYIAPFRSWHQKVLCSKKVNKRKVEENKTLTISAIWLNLRSHLFSIRLMFTLFPAHLSGKLSAGGSA